MVSKRTKIRRSADETRSVMLDAGMAQLEREGVQFGLDHVTLEAACGATGVPRSSSHAAWSLDDDYTPQALYQRELLRRWLSEREGEVFAATAQSALTRALEQGGDRLERGEIIRLAIQAAIRAAVDPGEDGGGSGFLSTDMAIKHALASQPSAGRDPAVAEWVRETEVMQRERRIADTYRPLAALLGLRPRAEFGDDAFHHLAVSIAALTEGITLRHLVVREIDYANQSVRNDDSEVPSTLLGVCVEALVELFFEESDDRA